MNAYNLPKSRAWLRKTRAWIYRSIAAEVVRVKLIAFFWHGRTMACLKDSEKDPLWTKNWMSSLQAFQQLNWVERIMLWELGFSVPQRLCRTNAKQSDTDTQAAARYSSSHSTYVDDHVAKELGKLFSNVNNRSGRLCLHSSVIVWLWHIAKELTVFKTYNHNKGITSVL